MNNDDVIAPECAEQLRKRGLRITEVGEYAGPSRSLLAFVEPVAKPKPRRWLVEEDGTDYTVGFGEEGRYRERVVREMKPISRQQIEEFWQARQVLSREHFIERLRALGVEVSDAE
jgi:hypothetical protein